MPVGDYLDCVIVFLKWKDLATVVEKGPEILDYKKEKVAGHSIHNCLDFPTVIDLTLNWEPKAIFSSLGCLCYVFYDTRKSN